MFYTSKLGAGTEGGDLGPSGLGERSFHSTFGTTEVVLGTADVDAEGPVQL